MAGDLIGNTVLTGLIVTNTPGSAQTNLPLPVSGGPAIAQISSGVTLSLQSGAQLSMATWAFSILTASSAAAIPSGCLGLIQLASGFSLIYKSGTTVYTVGASAVSA